jgi:hypothetical protein
MEMPSNGCFKLSGTCALFGHIQKLYFGIYSILQS